MSAPNDAGLIQPYLFFNGRCEEAVEFYKKALAAKVVMMMRHKDNPEPPPAGSMPPGQENKVMHVSFTVGQSVIMASDGCSSEPVKFEGFALSLTVATEADGRKVFNALVEGGKVTMPLMKTFWSPLFGMLEDKFGVGWMISMVHT